MPLFYSRRESVDRIESFYADMPERKAQDDVLPCRTEEDKGESPDIGALQSNYEKLPDYLKSCLDYCCMLSTSVFLFKKRLIQLLMAENLIPENPGEIMEDTAANIVEELVVLGMLRETYPRIRVSELYQKSCLAEVEEQDFVKESKNSPICAVINCKIDEQELPSNIFKSFLIRSLFLISSGHVHTETGWALQFIVVLNLRGGVEKLPDGVGDLVNLRYLGLTHNKINKLPHTIGNLQKLQTLDISYTLIRQLPVEILNMEQLRHLILNKQWLDGDKVRVPKGIRRLVNLYTLTGVHCGPGIASELSELTQVRELGLGCVTDDNLEELYAAIMKMEGLVSLSLSAQRVSDESGKKMGLLPELESFCPTPYLQELCLDGGLLEIPSWLSFMQNLTSLELFESHILENPSAVLQLLPKLKHLGLWDAYKTKCIGKEFCDAGGFPLLESLKICSFDLVEWSEIIDGAFPKLRFLGFYNCCKLRFLPEGLQYISTIEELFFSDLHGDLLRRLNGEENYKIKHISSVSYWNSLVNCLMPFSKH